MIWNELNAAIEANESFLISSHLSLDGDCVGSQLAFYWYLKSIGKRPVMYCADPVPSKFAFLKNSDQIQQEKPDGKFDVLMILDCSNPSRLGWENAENTADFIVNIDHHRDNSRFGSFNHTDTTAAATGEIIYRFFKDNDIDFPEFVSSALYTAILTDTGGFRFSNTNGKTLAICADLAQRGANCSGIYEKIYTSHSKAALTLQARIWSSLQFHLGGRVCSMDMPLSLLSETGAQYSDSEGMSDNTITAKEVEVGLLTKHSPAETHFSLRSKGSIDVGRVAQKIPGGGGHSCAAGCTIKKPYKEAMEEMLSIITKEMNR
ncbi:Phosphoesterase RecJ domain-containing protein [Chitinispirillum alkaliphilum]|nr:Phosphoesterase RecJ domain-containing protein [Chitinispirillum alkaliphilum]